MFQDRLCKECDKRKPIDSFPKNRIINGYSFAEYQCKDCLARNRKKIRSDRISKGLCYRCGKQPISKWTLCTLCFDKRSKPTPESNRKYREKVREKCLAYYGGKCVCCGETKKEFLTFDHINNDGAKHRKQYKGAVALTTWLAAHDFNRASEFQIQILCANCNHAKAYYGGCSCFK